MMDRRSVLGGSLLALLAGAGVHGQSAPGVPPTAPSARPSAINRLTAATRGSTLALARSGGAFSGAGWDLVVRDGRASQFVLLGEEHGVAEIAELSSALFEALRPGGYDRAAIEVSPPMAGWLDAEARNGTAGLKRFFADPVNAAAFYTLEPEAAFLARVRRAVRGPNPVFWGLDYEVGADRRLISELRQRAPDEARTAVERLAEASRASWAEYAATRDPAKIFSFGGDPELAAAVRAVWRAPDARSRLLLDTLEETLRINQDQVAGRYWQANDRRARFNRANFVRHWSAERARGRSPKVFFKFGSNHIIRGRNLTGVYDVGNLAAETAALQGASSLHLLVIPGAGSRRAQFDPSAFAYKSQPADGRAEAGLEPLVAGSESLVLDLRPLRSLAGAGLERVAPDLAKTVHGFDLAVILAGATASATLA